MNKREMIAYISASDFDPKMKAAACLGISLMSASDFEPFARKAEKGLELIKAGDYEGALAMLEEEGATPELMQVARSAIKTIGGAGA